VPSATPRSTRSIAVVAATAIVLATLALGFVAAPPAGAAQPAPGHTGLVPSTPRTNTPRISTGEIWDIEVVGQRVFIAGTFSSLQNTTGNTAVVNQRFLASYNYQTGLIDTAFRPTFGGGGVNAVEASPDGTRLYVAGSFNTVNGVTKRKIASISLTTGALAATNSTLYVGGNFQTVNGTARVVLVALNGATGAVVPGFVNNMSGGIGVNGALTVQQLKLTHDDTKLLVVHTGRKIANQDRYGVGLISTQTNQLLPWRTRLWDDNLQLVGGIQRVYAGDIAPNDQYFVVGSGSGGDRPPINDTAVAFPVAGNDNVQPLWVSRHFDSVDSVAITERAVYVGGHFGLPGVAHRPRPLARPGRRRLRHRLGPRRRGGPPRPHRRPQPGRWQGAGVEPRLELLRGQQGHGGHRPRPVRRRRRHVPGRQEHRPGRLLRLQLQPGALAHRHHRGQPDRGPGWSPQACSS